MRLACTASIRSESISSRAYTRIGWMHLPAGPLVVRPAVCLDWLVFMPLCQFVFTVSVETFKPPWRMLMQRS
jgi:hypothetical protein